MIDKTDFEVWMARHQHVKGWVGEFCLMMTHSPRSKPYPRDNHSYWFNEVCQVTEKPSMHRAFETSWQAFMSGEPIGQKPTERNNHKRIYR